jgi:hypothetical protein
MVTGISSVNDPRFDRGFYGTKDPPSSTPTTRKLNLNSVEDNQFKDIL